MQGIGRRGSAGFKFRLHGKCVVAFIAHLIEGFFVFVETADQYTLRNAGNSVVVLDEFRDCSAAKKTDCEATTKHHILPGRQWQLEKKPGREYRFQMIEGRDKTPMTVNSNG